MKLVAEHIIKWLIKYLDESKAKGFVVGVSGGVDSAVTSVLAAKTNAPLLALNLPIHQDLKQFSRSDEHINWLKKHFSNVESKTVDLTKVYDGFAKTVDANLGGEKIFLSLANARARLRMTTLYYYAASNDYLVLGTGNKVEDFGVGFYTKYGDGGVDLSPIADLNKTEVFALARELKIVESIQNAAPTDGLWADGRTDEEQLGATYKELEWAMEQKENLDINSLTSRQREVYIIYNRMHKNNLHKMVPIPICEVPNNLRRENHNS